MIHKFGLKILYLSAAKMQECCLSLFIFLNEWQHQMPAIKQTSIIDKMHDELNIGNI